MFKFNKKKDFQSEVQESPVEFKEYDTELSEITKKRDVIKAFLKFLVIFFIVSFIATSGILAYIFFIRRDVTINKVEINEEVNDDSISKAEAERRNLNNVETAQKDKTTLIKGYNFTLLTEGHAVNDPVLAKTLEITKDLKIKNVSNLTTLKQNKNFAPIYYFTGTTLNEIVAFDNAKLATLIVNDANTSGFKKIYLDTSFTYIKDYSTLITTLSTQLKAKNISFGIYLYPIWGKEVDYNNFLQVTNAFTKTVNLSQLTSKVDELVIQAYGYSNEYSILPGNVAPTEWTKQVIQYIASQGVDRNKVIFEINTDYYIWPEREVTEEPRLNYSVLEVQAEVLNNNTFQAKNYKQTSSNKFGDTLEDLKALELNSKKFISISPTQENIDKAINNIALYGFKGYILK